MTENRLYQQFDTRRHFMKAGKLDTETLRQIVLNKITYHREEVMVRPNIGEDCAIVDFGEYACVLSTDPITGAANEVGRLAVHISCNDIASSGVEPLGLLLTIMAPEGTTHEEIQQVMEQACETAAELKVEIIGGHTEITSAVNRIIVSTTAIGRQLKDKVVLSQGAKVGDMVLMTKSAGLEGTAILAYDHEERLRSELGASVVEEAKKMVEQISVIPEGIIGGAVGVSSMHDITEGGLLGAVWELCEASQVGVILYGDEIPIAPETEKICNYFQIDPLKLISSGCMIMTIGKEKEGRLSEKLKEKGISVSVIGEIVETGRTLIEGDKKTAIQPPERDELFKIV